MQIKTKTFGVVEIGESALYVKQEIQVNGRPENCGLYIAEKFTKRDSQCLRIAELIDDVDAFDARARKILHQELQDENALVIDFLDFHLDEVEDELKVKLQVSTIDRDLLLQKLDLKTMGFHQQESDGAVEFWLDYCPGENFSDQLLVVKFREDGDFIGVSHES